MARPLDCFPLIRARDVDGAREALSKVYSNDMKLEPLERNSVVDVTVNSCRLTHIGLNYSGYGAGVRVNFSASKFVTLSFPVAGSATTVVGGSEQWLGPARGLITPAGAGFAANLNASYEHIVLRLDPKALAGKLAAMIGAPVDGPLQFDPLLAFSGTHAQLLRDHFLFLVEVVSAPDAAVPGLLQEEFEQALMVMLLRASRHRYSRWLETGAPDAAPAEVRRAEDFIEANWQQPITLEDLAEVTGTNMLSLFRAFRKHRGYTPMEFAERVRNRKQGGF